MHRLRSLPLAAALVLAGVSGCAAWMPGPAPERALDASPAAASPTLVAASPQEADASPPGADAPATVVAPSVPEKAARRPAAATAPQPSSSARRATPPPGGAAQASGTQPKAKASGSQRLEAEPTGPTVTTYVYSDAPAPVRREAARGEAAPTAPSGRVPKGFNPYRIAYEPGTYRCELGRRVEVRSVSADLRSTVLRWGEGDYTLRSVDARSGALRYEDAGSGLAWIVLKDRSMLLDTRAGQRLANACRARG